ncbi:hypothetical protein H8N01_27260 [Streptomyces sp. AC536]|uniref:hypothetical protein n=1 Tax=Streptomyces buecherae TaxID=2763006 RepID=UPI001A298C67|nr:hypothetical protein [Streptomyces buecherae]MBC3986175.1 hypothetical protein [Streptomyces buecherae]
MGTTESPREWIDRRWSGHDDLVRWPPTGKADDREAWEITGPVVRPERGRG